MIAHRQVVDARPPYPAGFLHLIGLPVHCGPNHYCPFAEFPGLFQHLFEHTELHFAMEDQLMRDSRFPAEAEHTGEHLRVLGEFKQFKSRVDKGMLAFGRSFVRERLPQWFQLHVSTMDSALAAHINANSNQ